MSADSSFFQYLPVAEGIMARGLYLTGAGRAVLHPGDKYPPAGQPTLYGFDWAHGRTLPEFQLLLVTDGAGEFESEPTGSVAFQDAALLFVFPGVWHRFRPVSRIGWTERWLSFHGDLVGQLLRVGAFSPENSISVPRDAAALVCQFDRLLGQIQNRATSNRGLLAVQAIKLISDAISQSVETNPGAKGNRAEASDVRRDDPVVRRALEIIWTEGGRSLSVSEIARQLPVTRRTLDRRFAEVTGHSVLDEINACRLGRAKRLLCETDLPVKTVAHLAGFNSSERMRVLFVQREGLSPSAYRKQWAAARPKNAKLADRDEVAERIVC